MNYETTEEVETAKVGYLGFTRYVIVPNLYHGMFPYELDLCALNKNMYASEVEIKISRADLKNDLNKNHKHDRNYNLIKNLWFAIPRKIFSSIEFIPERAGIFIVEQNGRVVVHRKPTSNRSAKRWNYEQAYTLARLGNMRHWNERRKRIESDNKYYKMRDDYALLKKK